MIEGGLLTCHVRGYHRVGPDDEGGGEFSLHVFVSEGV